jgi:hypothetical protein
MRVIPRLRGPKQEDHHFQASLGYIVRPCLRKKRKTRKRSSTNIIKYIHILWRKILSVVHMGIEKVLFQIPSWARHGGIHL